MGWITGALTGDATAGTTIAAVLDTALLAEAWVKTTTGHVGATDGYTYDVYEVAGESTDEGFSWAFAVGVSPDETTIRFRAAEAWDSGTEKATNSVPRWTASSTGVDGVGLPNATSGTAEDLDASTAHYVDLVPSNVLDAYHLRVTNDVITGTLDTDYSLHAGLYERLSVDADHFPLILGSITTGPTSVSGAGASLNRSRMWPEAASGRTDIYDDYNVTYLANRAERNTDGAYIHEHAPRHDTDRDEFRFTADTYVLGGRVFVGGIAEGSSSVVITGPVFGLFRHLYSFGYPASDYARGDRMTIGIYTWTLTFKGATADTTSAAWISHIDLPA